MNRRELTFDEFCALPFEYYFGIHAETYASRLYRNNQHGLQMEVHTPKNKRTGVWGKGKRSFFLDRDEREFHSNAELYVAYMELVCGEKCE